MGNYDWVFGIGTVFMCYDAWGIGANDLANSCATSVGAGVFNLEQVIIVFGIFEFLGAVTMGSRVSKTIRKKIVNLKTFEGSPGSLMLGMACANWASGLWQQIATYLKLPVSTTHSVVGAIIGFSLAYRARDSVVWGFDEAGDGQLKGFFKIFISWFISPVLAGVFSLSFYTILKYTVFKHENCYERTLLIFPILTFLTFFMNTFFIIFKGSPQLDLDETPVWIAGLSATLIGLFTAAIAWFWYVPYKNDKIKAWEEGQVFQENWFFRWFNNLNWFKKIEVDNNEIESIELTNLTTEEKVNKIKDLSNKIKVVNRNEIIENLHLNADHIDEKTEKLCSSLQVITACFSAFAHGANDVANSIGPYATVYAIWQSGEIEKKNDVPLWMLFMGGFGIVIGLSTWGYKMIGRLGREITKVTASRGFVIEFNAALTVLIASVLEIPVSTTHCQIGAIIGCGIGDGFIRNVKWCLVKEIVLSWLITVPAAALISAVTFSFLLRCDYF